MVRTYKRKTERGVSQDVLERASHEVIDMNQHLRPVAEAYGVDKMTLHRYCKKKRELAAAGVSSEISGLQMKCGYARSRQLFSDSEESELVTYLLDASKMFFGLSPKETKKLAYELAISLGKFVPRNWKINVSAGDDWLSGFMHRHASVLSVRKPEATSLSRISSFNRTNVNLFYDNLEDLYRRFHFQPQAIWNVDETGLTTAQNPGKILAPKGVKQVGAVTSAERGTLVTLCCAVNALGHAIPPMFIFPRVRYHERLVDGGPPGCIGSCHKSGWMTKENFLVFLQHFVKHAKPSIIQPVLLLLDNHESHISVEGIQFAKDNGVHLLSFPPHCSHRLQPLDCTVYFPLKRYFDAQSDIWCNAHPGRPMQALDIPAVCAPAFKLAMTPANIQSGFEVTGIYPFNRHRIPDDAFLPSSVTDRPDPTSQELTDQLPVEGESSVSVSICSVPRSDTEPNEPSAVDSALDDQPMQPQASESEMVAAAGLDSVTASPLYAIRPLPKAGPRSEKRTGRKRGRTRILTDTPEKLLVEQENASRSLLRTSKQIAGELNNGRKTKTRTNAGKQKPGTSQDKEERSRLTKAAGKAINAEKRKKQQTRKKGCKLLIESHQSDSEAEEQETFCLICVEPFSNSKPGEHWVQCNSCNMWAHEECTDGSLLFVCQNCESDDDM